MHQLDEIDAGERGRSAGLTMTGQPTAIAGAT
jgi:hypothetical protein